MKEIIKPGKVKFETTCPKCGCVFTYESEDIFRHVDLFYVVECPNCKSCIEHPRQNGSEDNSARRRLKRRLNENMVYTYNGDLV